MEKLSSYGVRELTATAARETVGGGEDIFPP
jgi:hypothetical protein